MAPEREPSTVSEPEPCFTRLQAQEYMNKHYPQTQDQLQKHVDKTLHFYNTRSLPPTDNILWEWFQGNFSLWTIRDFQNLALSTQKELRAYLRCGGVYVRPDRGSSIAQTLYEVANEDKQHEWSQDDIKQAGPDLNKHTITLVYITPERNLCPEMEAKIDAYATAFQATLKPHTAAMQPAMQPALQPPVSQPSAVTAATPVAPPVASVPAIAIGTAPPLLQPTATSFRPAIAANPVPQYQSQPQYLIQPTQPQPQLQPQSQVSLGAKPIAKVAKIYTDEKSTAGIKATANSKDNPDDLNATKPPQQPALQPALQPAPQHSILSIQPQPPKLPQALAKQPQPPASLQALATLVPLANPAKLIVQAYTDDDQRNVPPLGILRVASYP
jgi:hypothetical protein